MSQNQSPEIIHAPFSDDQIAALNSYQKLSEKYHPYTCPLHPGPIGMQHVLLIATTPGWRCSQVGCPYIQDWAHQDTVDIAKREFANSKPKT